MSFDLSLPPKSSYPKMQSKFSLYSSFVLMAISSNAITTNNCSVVNFNVFCLMESNIHLWKPCLKSISQIVLCKVEIDGREKVVFNNL